MGNGDTYGELVSVVVISQWYWACGGDYEFGG